MRVIFLGPPGAGKGTQAQKIQEKTSIPLLVMGDMLRASVKRMDEVGKKAKSYMDQGMLVPDEVVIEVILNRLEQDDCKQNGFMLDGFPRTSEQAAALDEHLLQKSITIDFVVFYSISSDFLIKRITGRRVCSKCNKIYNINTDKLNGEICPDEACRGELTQRKDDTEEVLSKRLQEYDSKTAPLLDYYKNKNLLKEISAERAIDEVFNDSIKLFA